MRERAWRAVALLVAGAFFMEILDGTVIATAAPSMAASFGVQSVDINVTMTVYLLTVAVFTPVSGWIADRYGSRTIFVAAVAVFTVASALCAVSSSLGVLTAMRVLQGIGGAMMVPVGRLVVLRSTSKAELMHAIAYLTWPALVAPLVAPALGGALATYASWRWIFALNIPLGVIGLLLALRIVPNVREPSMRPLDWWGFVLLGSGLAALIYGLELINSSRIRWLAVIGYTSVGLVVLALAVRHLAARPHPLINLRILRVPTFRITNLGGSVFRVAISAVPFLLPLMFQDAFGWTPLKSGLLVMAVFAGNLGIKPFTTPIMRWFGFRRVLLVVGVGAAVNIAACGLLTGTTPLVVVALVLFLSGVLRSVGFTAYNGLAFADLGPAEMSDANTLSATIQQLSTGLGIAAGALALRVGAPLADLVGLAGVARSAFLVAFVLVGILALAAVVETVLLAPHAGAEVSAGR